MDTDMAKSNSKSGSRSSKSDQPIDAPWISRSTGLIVIGVVSVLLAVYTGWQIYPAGGLVTAIEWGLGSAAALWLVFGLSYLFNTLIRPRNR